jgi:hypothetical protein
MEGNNNEYSGEYDEVYVRGDGRTVITIKIRTPQEVQKKSNKSQNREQRLH